MNIVHLRLHSEYSLEEGILRLPQAMGAAKDMGIPALALTDVNNLFGSVRFTKLAMKSGVKPIIGVDAWVREEEEGALFRLILLCCDPQGYQRLSSLLSLAQKKARGAEPAAIPVSLLDEGTQGLLALSGERLGPFYPPLARGDWTGALKAAKLWARRFPNRFYLETWRLGLPHEKELGDAFRLLAEEASLPLAATHPIHFLAKEDFEAQQARVAIARGTTLVQEKKGFFTEGMAFPSAREMQEKFADLPEALENAFEAAKRCNFAFTLGKVFLPAFPVPEGEDPSSYLVRKAKHGLQEKIPSLPEDYAQRLEKELSVIAKMGYAGYFLTVADFIAWAKKENIPVGPGRGSGAGSLVAWALGITMVDPLRFDLLFERFLNPERVSMPDFDIDFCQEGRDRVIDYVRKRFGEERVAQIATYGTMAARAVVRDVGRVLGMSYGYVDQIANLIPRTLGISLAAALEEEALLASRIEKEPEVAKLFELARKLEGLPRNVSTHAGGVLIAPLPIETFCPLWVSEEKGGSAKGDSCIVMSQLDKDDIEALGLVKFDFLGLKTLTAIAWCLEEANRLRQDQEALFPLVLEDIPFDDPKTFALLCEAKTDGVFQLESRGMKDLMRRLHPDTFEDIVALVALFRPGPLGSGMVEDFIQRKHGNLQYALPHQDLEEILRPTYGVIVYQEQVMRIAQKLAGYSLGEADLLRRAMGKKKPQEMALHRKRFTEGALARGIGLDAANRLFDLMEHFAEYGFNKSHSVAYAMIAYETAYLKAHEPAAFFAASLSVEMHQTDTIRRLIEDAKALGITVLPPDAATGQWRFRALSKESIAYGLGAIKGLGFDAVKEIIQARAQGPFNGFLDFLARVDGRKVNRKSLETLIFSGALDGLASLPRQAMWQDLDMYLASAQKIRSAPTQKGLFGENIVAFPGAQKPQANGASPASCGASSEDLAQVLASEKRALGFCFSGHLFSAYAEKARPLIRRGLASLPLGETALAAGVVAAVRPLQTKRGKMAFVTLEDDQARLEVRVFSGLFAKCRMLLQEDEPLVARGKVTPDEHTGGLALTAEELWGLDEARLVFARAVVLRLSVNDGGLFLSLKKSLAPFFGGDLPLGIEYETQSNIISVVAVKPFWLKAEPAVLKILEDLGEERFVIKY